MLSEKDNHEIMSLALACSKNDGTFNKVNEFFKNVSDLNNNGIFSEEVMKLLTSQAKKNRLNVFFQNVLCMM